MKTSRDLPDFLHLGDELGVEAFYNFAVTPAFMVTADLQVTDSAKEGIGGLLRRCAFNTSSKHEKYVLTRREFMEPSVAATDGKSLAI